MPERCFCFEFDGSGAPVDGRGVEVVEALLQEGLISSADLGALSSSPFYSGVGSGSLWTGGVFVGLVFVGLIVNGFGFLLDRCRARPPGEEEDDPRHGAAPPRGPLDLGVGPRRQRRLFRLRPLPHTPP